MGDILYNQNVIYIILTYSGVPFLDMWSCSQVGVNYCSYYLVFVTGTNRCKFMRNHGCHINKSFKIIFDGGNLA